MKSKVQKPDKPSRADRLRREEQIRTMHEIDRLSYALNRKVKQLKEVDLVLHWIDYLQHLMWTSSSFPGEWKA